MISKSLGRCRDCQLQHVSKRREDERKAGSKLGEISGENTRLRGWSRCLPKYGRISFHGRALYSFRWPIDLPMLLIALSVTFRRQL